MLEIAGRKQEGWLGTNDLRKFPYQDLHNIDQLWIKYSNGRFGFSVQQRIWRRLGGIKNTGYETWIRFSESVGWRVNDSWIAYRYLSFTLKAPEGHLPYCRAWLEGGWRQHMPSRFSSLALKLEESEMQFDPSCCEFNVKPESLTNNLYEEVGYARPSASNSQALLAKITRARNKLLIGGAIFLFGLAGLQILTGFQIYVQLSTKPNTMPPTQPIPNDQPSVKTTSPLDAKSSQHFTPVPSTESTSPESGVEKEVSQKILKTGTYRSQGTMFNNSRREVASSNGRFCIKIVDGPPPPYAGYIEVTVSSLSLRNNDFYIDATEGKFKLINNAPVSFEDEDSFIWQLVSNSVESSGLMAECLERRGKYVRQTQGDFIPGREYPEIKY